MRARQTFKLVYKVGMTAVTVALAGFAFLAWREATPGNGLLLIAGILAVLALMALLSISKLDDQDRQAATWAGIIGDARKTFRVTTGSVAPPEVHRVDAETFAAARTMAAAGAQIDDICRVVEPGFDRLDAMHRQALRQMMQEAVREE